MCESVTVTTELRTATGHLKDARLVQNTGAIMCACCNRSECRRLVWSVWLTQLFLSLSLVVGRAGWEVWLVIFLQLYSYWHCRSDLSAIKVPKLKTLLFCVSSTQRIVIERVCVCYEWKLHVDLVCSEYVCGIRQRLVDTPVQYFLMACKVNS